MVGVVVGVTLVGVAVPWMVFGGWLRLWIRIAITILLVPPVTTLSMYLGFGEIEPVITLFGPATMGQGLLMMIFLSVCRLSGYRLQREQISGE